MKKIYSYLLFSLAIPVYLIITASSSGSPGGASGSPGDGANTCNQCHVGNPNTASNWITTNIPVTGYLPGETYTITATGTHNGVQRFGFELTAEDDAGNKVGTFVITNAAETKLTNGNKAVTHKSAGITPSGNSKSWSVNWTAPTTNVGEVSFFAAFNAANGNGNTSGDVIYVSSLATFPNTTSVDEMDDMYSFYPNPAQNMLNVEIAGIEQSATFEIFNLNGQLIKTFPLVKGNNILNLELTSKGTYLVKLDNQNKTQFKKLIVL